MNLPDIMLFGGAEDYFRAFFALNKQEKSTFSHRAFAARIGWPPSYLNDVMSGQKPLTVTRAIEFANYFAMTPPQTERLIFFSFQGMSDSGVREFAQKQLRVNADVVPKTTVYQTDPLQELTADIRFSPIILYARRHRACLTFEEAQKKFPVIDFRDQESFEELVKQAFALGYLQKNADGQVDVLTPNRILTDMAMPPDETAMRRLFIPHVQYAEVTKRFCLEHFMLMPRRLGSAFIYLTEDHFEAGRDVIDKARQQLSELSRESEEDRVSTGKEVRVFKYDLNLFPVGPDVL